MAKAIELIVSSYATLKDRKTLEEIRDHRKRLLNEHRMRSNPVLKFDKVKEELHEEIDIVEAALLNLQDHDRARLN